MPRKIIETRASTKRPSAKEHEIPEVPPEIMTAQEVAAYLRVSLPTVMRQAKAGELPGKQLGSIWRFSRKVIQKMMTQE
ncbi:MAG: helix-turn-helix domain-containing protein [Janthinobacterium lividum]